MTLFRCNLCKFHSRHCIVVPFRSSGTNDGQEQSTKWLWGRRRWKKWVAACRILVEVGGVLPRPITNVSALALRGENSMRPRENQPKIKREIKFYSLSFLLAPEAVITRASSDLLLVYSPTKRPSNYRVREGEPLSGSNQTYVFSQCSTITHHLPNYIHIIYFSSHLSRLFQPPIHCSPANPS